MARVKTLRGRLLLLIVSLLMLSLSQIGHAVPVNYTVTLNTILNNTNGTWGGNLNVGAGQNLNLSVIFQYESVAVSTSGNKATFGLLNLQVLDNTNGLASAVITGSGGITIEYNFSGTNDRFSGASFGSPGGSVAAFGTIGQLGNLGDELPFGAGLDALVNAAGIDNLIARAPDIFNDNVAGVNGPSFIQSGSYIFSSARAVPEPSVLALLAIGLVGVWSAGKRKLAV